MTILNTEKLPITLKHVTIVDCTLYRPIRSVTLVKSIGSAKPGKAQVINFKARVRPEARALEKTGLFSITTEISCFEEYVIFLEVTYFLNFYLRGLSRFRKQKD